MFCMWQATRWCWLQSACSVVVGPVRLQFETRKVFFLGTFAKLRKAKVSFAMSVRLSVRVERLGSYCADFHTVWHLRIFFFRKSVGRIQGSLKSGKNLVYLPHPTFPRSILILSFHLRVCLPSGLLPSSFPTEALCAPLLSPVCATCPAHLSLLDLITRMVFGEEYRA